MSCLKTHKNGNTIISHACFQNEFRSPTYSASTLPRSFIVIPRKRKYCLFEGSTSSPFSLRSFPKYLGKFSSKKAERSWKGEVVARWCVCSCLGFIPPSFFSFSFVPNYYIIHCVTPAFALGEKYFPFFKTFFTYRRKKSIFTKTTKNKKRKREKEKELLQKKRTTSTKDVLEASTQAKFLAMGREVSLLNRYIYIYFGLFL